MYTVQSRIETFVASLVVRPATRKVYSRLLRRCAREVGFDDDGRLELWFEAASSPTARRLRRSVIRRFLRHERGPGDAERLLRRADEIVASTKHDAAALRLALAAYCQQCNPWDPRSASDWAVRHPRLASVLTAEWPLIEQAAAGVRPHVGLPALCPTELPDELRAAIAALLPFVRQAFVPRLRWGSVTEVAGRLTLEFQDGSSLDGAIFHRPTPGLDRALRLLRQHFERVVGCAPYDDDLLVVDLAGQPLDPATVQACTAYPPTLMSRAATTIRPAVQPSMDVVDWDALPDNPFS